MVSFNAPANIAENIISQIGVKKCQLGLVQVIIMGMLAGAFISFGAQLSTRIQTGIPEFGLRLFLGGAVFSVGLMLVMIAGAELFTGNNLIFMSVLSGNTKFSAMLKYWTIVYFANFAGALFFVLIMHLSGLVEGEVAKTASDIAHYKVGLSAVQIFFRGILCNWIVCLAVWLALAANDIAGKILAIFFPIMGFVASGFEHSIANMYFIPMGMIVNTEITMAGLTHNLVWSTLGNIVGGAGLVAGVYYLIFRKCTVPKKAS